MLAPAAKTL